MVHRRSLRLVALVLLAWIAVDLTAIDTCVPDFAKQPAAACPSVRASAPAGGPSSHAALPHPDQCFSHGLWAGADSSAALAEPVFTSGAVPDVPARHLLRASASLYHPPQRLA